VHGSDEELTSIPGSPPSLRSPPPGCRFHPRCGQVIDRCRTEEPLLRELGERRAAACHVAK
jgi:peptide/nickel transport system ATP-binding protein